MFTAFFKAFRQIWDPASRRAIWISLITALAVLVCLWVAVGISLAGIQLFETWWIDLIADLLGGAATVVLTWCMFPAVVSAVMCLLLDGIAEAVEASHYAHLPPASGQSLARVLPAVIRFLAVMVLVNLGLLFFLVFRRFSLLSSTPQTAIFLAGNILNLWLCAGSAGKKPWP